MYDENWREWILTVRRQVGLIDLGDMLYVRSEHYRQTRGEAEKPVLFGEKEGRIALANRRKDPLYLFAALARHLGYPTVPRPRPEDSNRMLHSHLAAQDRTAGKPPETARGGNPRGNQSIAILCPGQPSREAVG